MLWAYGTGSNAITVDGRTHEDSEELERFLDALDISGMDTQETSPLNNARKDQLPEDPDERRRLERVMQRWLLEEGKHAPKGFGT
ncbi:hypothetical protein NDU88_004513 [Pleurodeles waltl]|uniref:Uncharacterized protein n=1 Tax=Pleurodeles waltl TaxID=8319 RepID=A0AAV7UFF3_PLEWA|nr:hypothetical protein NDU88_004513 [Pleurodeles waltl]